MKFSINKKNLLKQVSIAQKAISSRTTLQILEGILFEVNNNQLKLTATDLNISIETFTECEVTIPGNIVINSKLIGDITRKLPDGIVYIEVKENKINLKCENAEFNFLGTEGYDYPDLPKYKEENIISFSNEEFKSIIRQTVFAASTDETRPIFTGVYFDGKKANINFVSLDGYRLSVKTIENKTNELFELVIPARSLVEISKLIEENEEDMQISIAKGQIVFILGNTKFYSRLLEGEFYNYQEMLRMQETTVVKINRRALQHALERASLLAKEDRANLIKFIINEESTTIKSNSEIGDVVETIEHKKEGLDINIAFNSRYILEGIKNMEYEEIIMKFSDPLKPCVISGSEDENYTYLVLPVRLAKESF